MQPFNPYGDDPANALNGFGVDISTQRSDELDLLMLKDIDQTGAANLQVLDLGCGTGGHAIKLALAGCTVTAVDIQHLSATIAATRTQYKIPTQQLTFIQADIRHTAKYLTRQFDMIYSQRALHYINYADAVELLKAIKPHLKGKLYLSVSGLHSELGNDYAGAAQPLPQRFGLLSDAMSAKHRIDAPVCLYRKNEFEQLLLHCGFKVESIYTSAFGNVKAVAN